MGSLTVSTPNRTREAKRPARGALTRERIAGAALDLVDREGLGALSMRRLARQLGTGTMTLYGYFRDKDELLDAIVDAAAERHPTATPDGSWREVLRSVMVQLHAALAAHPSLVELRLRRPLMSPGAMRSTEVGLRAMLGAGFTPADAASGYRVLFLYTFAFVTFSAEEVSAELRAGARAAFAALDAAEYPAVAEAGEEMADALGGAEQFLFGVERILDGLEARLKGRRPARRR